VVEEVVEPEVEKEEAKEEFSVSNEDLEEFISAVKKKDEVYDVISEEIVENKESNIRVENLALEDIRTKITEYLKQHPEDIYKLSNEQIDELRIEGIKKDK